MKKSYKFVKGFYCWQPVWQFVDDNFVKLCDHRLNNYIRIPKKANVLWFTFVNKPSENTIRIKIDADYGVYVSSGGDLELQYEGMWAETYFLLDSILKKNKSYNVRVEYE